ncbi:hypothetical protein SDC9_173748 [bioreactor metagenome]|uniref:Uncharacterized protein n=1 Tax=bioreactor metagenome TaxID=1076179 RepID=A0A645GQT5_9ZZZZ
MVEHHAHTEDGQHVFHILVFKLPDGRAVLVLLLFDRLGIFLIAVKQLRKFVFINGQLGIQGVVVGAVLIVYSPLAVVVFVQLICASLLEGCVPLSTVTKPCLAPWTEDRQKGYFPSSGGRSASGTSMPIS